MRIKVFLTTLVILVSLCGLASASTLSNWGPTGVSEVPTAYVLNLGVAVAPNIGFYGEDTLLRIPITLGLGVGAEIGVTGLSLSSSSNPGYIIHAKFNVLEEKPLLFALSIGGLFDVNNAIGGTSFYVVLSKTLGNLKGHIGAGSGIYEGIFGALEFKLTNNMDLVCFYKSEQFGAGLNINLLSFLNITATYHQGLVLQLGANISL